MDEKKSIKISLSTFFLILAIIIIIIMGYFMYKLYNEKTMAEKKVANLQNEMNGLESTVANLQGIIENSNSSTSDLVDSTSNKMITNEEQEYVKNIIETYYKLLGKKEEEPASMLMELGLSVQEVQDPEYYTPDGYMEYPNGEYMWTGIQYKDFYGLMSNYMSENILNSNFKEFVEYKDYLYISEYFNDSSEYSIQSMTLQESSENRCSYLVTVKKLNNSKVYTKEIILLRGNGDFIISEINEK